MQNNKGLPSHPSHRRRHHPHPHCYCVFSLNLLFSLDPLLLSTYPSLYIFNDLLVELILE